MKRWRKHILLFAGVYMVALVATFPAALALRWSEPVLAKLPQRPQLQGVTGSLWSGHAVQANYRGMSLGELHWQLSPWSLLIGRISVAMQMSNSDGNFETDLSTDFNGSRVRLSDMNGQLPAALVKSFAPSLPITPTGNLAVNMDEAVIEAAKLKSLDGRVVWNKGGVSSPLALEFGDLVAEFSSSEGGISGRIKDSCGPLQLEADLKLSADGSYNLTGKSTARASATPALKTSLSLLGQPDISGMIPFRFNGRL